MLKKTKERGEKKLSPENLWPQAGPWLGFAACFSSPVVIQGTEMSSRNKQKKSSGGRS